MLEIIDVLNKSVLSENCVLVSFDVVSIIPNIDNKSGFISVKRAFADSNFDVDSTQCISDALEVCLKDNNSKFNHQHFYKLMVRHRILICLVPMVTSPWPNVTLLPISSILRLVFGKDLEMIFLYYSNMVPLFCLAF